MKLQHSIGLAVFCLFIVGSLAENILFLLPIASKSHKNVFDPLIKALANKGHKITVASPVAPTKPHPNIHEIVPIPLEELFQQAADPFEERRNKLGSRLNFTLLIESCEKAHLNEEFISLQQKQFDLVFLNGIVNDCFTGLIYKIGAPFAMLTTLATPSVVAESTGVRLPPSFVPGILTSNTDEMNFRERLTNTFMEHFMRFFMTRNNPAMEATYRKFLGEDVPGIPAIKGNVSMIFSNSYFPLNFPRPLMPDIVEIGGMHCGPSKPLPKDLEEFLSGAEHGFIYFSMGSILKTDQMPEEMRKTFLKVFSRMKQRVIWKWNSGHMDNLPSNVKLSKWLPQQDILGHPNIKLFISHGGLLSTQEAAYHGVPVLGIPMFGDQDLNVKQAATHGYAVMLEILDLTEELLEDRLNTILNDPRFTLKAKHLSSIIKDQPQTPLDRAKSNKIITRQQVVSSERILFVLPIATKSHKNVFEPLYTALAAKGHDITVVSSVKPSKPKANIREIVPISVQEIFGQLNAFEDRGKTFLQRFSRLLKEKFDLVFLNAFNDCFAGFVYKIGAPFIIVTTGATPSFIAELVGNRLPTSFVPLQIVPGISDDMTFGQRTLNFLITQMFHIMRAVSGKEAAVYRKALGEDLPEFREIEGNVSMIFSNSYFPLTYPRPLLPDIVEVGGMHCRPAKPLPKDLDDFLTGAEHGVIYFSMGSVLETDQMPDDMRQKFLNVFSRLKQRVIWKWNSGQMDNIPSNVKLSSWLPQQDILGHPNVRIFMTHGGLLSTQEAVYHGVPLLAIPMFADQDLNAKQAVTSGYALSLEILELSEEILEDLLNQLLNEPKYSKKAKDLSAVIRDQMETPLERALFWTEYVMRHGGAVHLRSAARKLNTIQYHSIDVYAFIATVLIAVVTVLVILLKFIFKKIASKLGRKTGDQKVKKQ
ncbi:unnamed protein product [Allacma fusca]|uniref:UDP-glycosyltransferases domain-containing protein n=1 Tax=Allacma fusca TaxID=39272 RepID=A0A8J2LM82_9HEXA|nr:unnamed protein product [Allacma fusca]